MDNETIVMIDEAKSLLKQAKEILNRAYGEEYNAWENKIEEIVGEDDSQEAMDKANQNEEVKALDSYASKLENACCEIDDVILSI